MAHSSAWKVMLPLHTCIYRQDLPIAVELQWGPDGTMNAILSQFQLVGFTFSFLKYVSLSTVAFALKG